MKAIIRWWCAVVLVAGWVATADGGDAPPETVRYVRPAGDKFVTECEFVIARDGSGWSITSRTDRGATMLVVEARYDAEDRLTGAKAELSDGGRARVATVKVKDGRASVERAGAAAAEFDVPKGTIVTSAPDWSDVFLLCRRYDRTRKGKQAFPAIWIHPGQQARRLTFSVEWLGADRVERDGKGVELGRYRIRIRDGSAYAAWADAEGMLVRLVPLSTKGTAPGITREGYEKAAARLRPTDQ